MNLVVFLVWSVDAWMNGGFLHYFPFSKCNVCKMCIETVETFRWWAYCLCFSSSIKYTVTSSLHLIFLDSLFLKNLSLGIIHHIYTGTTCHT